MGETFRPKLLFFRGTDISIDINDRVLHVDLLHIILNVSPTSIWIQIVNQVYLFNEYVY